MGKVSEIFRHMQEVTEHDLQVHDGQEGAAAELEEQDTFVLDDRSRAEMLGMVHDASKRGWIDAEDEVDLEFAIGYYGEPENMGWPEHTTPVQRVAVRGILTAMAVAIQEEKRGSTSRLRDLVQGIHDKMGLPGQGLPEFLGALQGGGEIIAAIPLGNPDSIPKEARKILEENGVLEEKQDKEAIDWLRQGYL